MLPLFALVAFAGRQTVDLNAGWQVARVPSAPSIWTGPDAVSTANWHVTHVSSEETSGESAPANKAFDGKPDTFWHTEWSRRQAPYPHEITIDLGAPTETVGLRLLPRQTGAQNGRPNHFRLFLDDVKLLETSVPDSGSLFEVRFPRAKGRILRLEFVDGHRPEPFLVLAEIGLIRPSRLGSDWASQYTAATVQLGDARFDPKPADVEKLKDLELPKLANWRSVTLPDAAWTRPLDNPEIWQGVAYYRRKLPNPAPGRRTVFSLQGMQSVDIWLNGRYLASRRGGYLPLKTEIKAGGDLLVRVDNSDNPLIPPGKPQAQLDFMYGNGLIGNAKLETTDPLHIEDGLRVEPPKLGKNWASTWIYTTIRNDGRRERKLLLRQSIFDTQNKRVATRVIPDILLPNRAEKIAQSIDVAHPRLWSPDSPTLYRLHTAIEENGREVDSTDTRIGFRTIEVSKTRGFLFNGKPLRLVGTNRHQDYPWVGPAIPDAAQKRDALLIKRSGHNIVRLSHYDQSPAFMDACDELGILTIPCIPGWQFINRDPRFADRVIRDIKESVRRDRNRPSVAFWEASLNETYPPAALAKTWHDAAKSEFANLTAGDMGKDAPWDIIYNTWKEDLSRPADPVLPGYVREYGDYEFGGANSTARVRIREGYDKLLNETWNHVWSLNKFRPQYPSTMGVGTWEMFDHNVPWDFAVSASGLADMMRREKPSFWFFASQQAQKPYLKVAATWQPGPARRTIIAFSDAPKASLYINGRLVQTASAARGPETPYDLNKAFQGTDTANLGHPPIVFGNVPFTSGTLKIVASNGASETVRTAGTPVRLKVWVDDLGVAPTRNDLVFVRAAVVDANGTICPEDSRTIRFSGVAFAGESKVKCEMGIASVLVRTPSTAAEIAVHAASNSLKGDTNFQVK